MIAQGTRWPAFTLARGWWLLWLWIVAALAVLFTDWFAARMVAATLLLFFLPGWAWLEAFAAGPLDVLWRLVLAAALSLGLIGVGTLYLAYLPGPLTEGHILALCAVVTLPPCVLALRRQRLLLSWPDRRLGLALLLIMAVAASVRLPRLGYAEFHEDEVEVTSLAVRAIKGEDYAVFLHRKGPEQMLLPLSGWLLAGRITEGWVRLPFALASLLGVLALGLFAYRLAGLSAALVTGLLLALNGYAVAFGRMVQYQALILFLAALGFVCLWWVAKDGDPKLLWIAMLSLSVSLLAHYDALVYLPVAAYLAWRVWRRRPDARLALAGSTLMALGVLLSFYVPYLRDPQFQHTRAYLVDSRVGTQWLYNNLKTLGRLDADYSSRFYLPVLWLLSLAFVLRYRPVQLGSRLVLGAALVAALTTMRWPELWELNAWNLAFVPWLVLLAIVAIGAHQRQPGYEAFWIWWGVPFLAYVFLVDDPRTHLYVAYPGWALVAGLGAAALWRVVCRAPDSQARLGRPLLLATAATLALLVAGYQAAIFLLREPAFLKLRDQWEGTAGELLYGDLPEPRTYFGYPRHAGWKGAGWLVSSGQLPSDFRSVGQEFSVPIWYTFETPRSCYGDPELYLVAQSPETLDGSLRERLAAEYVHAATVYTEDLPRIFAFVRGQAGDAPDTYNSAELELNFDRAATPGRFALAARPTRPLEAQFGQVALLTGFTLSSQEIAAGEVLSVHLYWQSLTATDVAYRAFVHLGENPVWGQHDDDPACRLPTTLWRPGQVAIGQFRVAPASDTPPGDYPLVLGLYHPTTGERLPIQDVHQQPIGDSLVLTTVKVVERE